MHLSWCLKNDEVRLRRLIPLMYKYDISHVHVRDVIGESRELMMLCNSHARDRYSSTVYTELSRNEDLIDLILGKTPSWLKNIYVGAFKCEHDIEVKTDCSKLFECAVTYTGSDHSANMRIVSALIEKFTLTEAQITNDRG